jgi:hypothetical protein
VNIYRVVREDGSEVGHLGRGSDPFTNKAAAKRRATQLTNESTRYGVDPTKYKVQVSYAEWEDLNE